MLVIHDERFVRRAEIIWKKGTNRAEFFRGESNKYNWVDIGSSFLPSVITAAFLFAQLENLDVIQQKRKEIWNKYYEGLKHLEQNNLIQLPFIPPYASNNAHMFYLLCASAEMRSQLITDLKQYDILSEFHYLFVHTSHYYTEKYIGEELPAADRYTANLLRLPFYIELSQQEIIINHFKNKISNDIQ